MGEVCEGECMGRRSGDEPMTFTRCHSCELPQLYEDLERWNSVLKVIRGKFCLFSVLLALLIFYFRSSRGTMSGDPAVAGNGLCTIYNIDLSFKKL